MASQINGVLFVYFSSPVWSNSCRGPPVGARCRLAGHDRRETEQPRECGSASTVYGGELHKSRCLQVGLDRMARRKIRIAIIVSCIRASTARVTLLRPLVGSLHEHFPSSTTVLRLLRLSRCTTLSVHRSDIFAVDTLSAQTRVATSKRSRHS